MKAKQALDIDALVAAAVPPKENPQLAFTVDVRVVSEANERCHWAARLKRKKQQQQAIRDEWLVSGRRAPCLVPCTVRFTRVGPQKLDDDNLAGGFKFCRDEVSHLLGIDDGDERIKWEYAQVAVGKRIYAVRVEVI